MILATRETGRDCDTDTHFHLLFRPDYLDLRAVSTVQVLGSSAAAATQTRFWLEDGLQSELPMTSTSLNFDSFGDVGGDASLEEFLWNSIISMICIGFCGRVLKLLKASFSNGFFL